MAAERKGCLASVLSVLQAMLASSPTSGGAALPYRVRPRFISPNEAAIYNLLERANDQRVVFANVRLSDLIDVTLNRSSERSTWQTAFNRIGQRQVDFVVCDRATFRPLLAIELDDATHDRPSRSKRDALENDVLNSAGLPLLRLRGRYERAQLLEQVERALVVPATPKMNE